MVINQADATGALSPVHQPILLEIIGVVRFYAGVGALVALSLTVTAGLLTAERGLFDAHQRVWMQSAHRTLGTLAVIFLLTHVVSEVTADRITMLNVAVPFLATSVYLGLGSVAGYLMLFVMWSGLVRSRFADSRRPGLWRVMHAIGYACWPAALLHGLRAGRPPAAWVTTSYVLLLALVTFAIGLRVASERSRRRDRAARISSAARATTPPRPLLPATTAAAQPMPPVAPTPLPPSMMPTHPAPTPPRQTRPPAPPHQAPHPAPPHPAPPHQAVHPAPPRQAPTPPRQAPAATRPHQLSSAGPVPRPPVRPAPAPRQPRGPLDEADERYFAALRGDGR